MSFKNTSRLSNSIDPDNAQHFSLNLALAVDKVYQQNSFSRQIRMMYIPYSLFLVNSLIFLSRRHKLFTYYIKCPVLITFANNFDQDQADKTSGMITILTA